MILVDMNQVTISNLMMQVGSKRQNDVDENLVRHMVLNSLRMYRAKFFEEFGELAQQIKDIGTKETDTKLKCLFTMNYYDEVGTSVDTFRFKFERYFLKQRKLDQDELSNFRRN